MSDHTKGPWSITRRSKYAVRISGQNWDEFAKVYVRLSDDDEDHKEGWANANLIAAAPDLLTALKRLLEQYDEATHCEYDGTSMLVELLAQADHARAAIAKAEGKE